MTTKTPPPLNMNRYLRLVRKFPLRTIESEQQHDQALEVIDELVDKERTVEEDAYLGALADIVWVYEEKLYPDEPVEDSVMLAHLIESKGVTQVALARGAGIAESTISAVLNGSRRLTRAQVGKVAAWFKVSPELFDLGS